MRGNEGGMAGAGRARAMPGVAIHRRRWRRAAAASLCALAGLVLADGAGAALPGAMAALGDSLTRAYGSVGPTGDNPADSWSTGRDPQVVSHYWRLRAASSGDIAAANLAVSGSKMAHTSAQAAGVAAGTYVTLWSGTNDVCTPTVAQMTTAADYAQQLRQTLTRLAGVAGVRVLVLSIPNWYQVWQTLSADADAQAAWGAYPNRCPSLLAPTATPADRNAVAQRIVELNAAASAVCAEFASCTSDGGRIHALTFTAQDLAFDYFHLSLTGQSRIADAAWQASPYAAEVRQLGTTVPGASSGSPGNGFKFGTIFELPTEASTLDFAFHAEGRAASQRLRPVIYNVDAGGSPTTLVAVGAEAVVAAGQQPGWVRATLPATTLRPGRYLLGLLSGPTASGTAISLDNVTGGGRFNANAYPTPSQTWGTSSTSTQALSVFVDYRPPVQVPSPPQSTAPPTIAGTPVSGQTLTASPGTWANGPTGYAYQWRRCDGAGVACADIPDAGGSSYTPGGTDVGTTLRVRVTATNAAGSASAESAATSAVTAPAGAPPGFDSAVTDPGCGGCAVTATAAGELQATVAGGADALDTAYGLRDFGGPGAASGGVFVRAVLRLAPGEVPAANLAVFQVRDTANALVYELFVATDRSLRVWSPAGGLRATALGASTGAVVPNNGTSVRVEVFAEASGSLTVRVDGVDRLALGGLAGASTGPQRFLRAGIDHYDSASASDPVTVVHGSVATSTTGWLGAPGSGGTTQPPQNTAPPALGGTAVEGQTLSTTTGSWANNPTSYSYRWRRCDAGGGACVDIGGATAAQYAVTAADVGATLRARVTATNAVGSASADSVASAVVAAQAPADPANLAPDPDFESPPAGSYYTAGAAAFSWATDTARSAGHSLKIVSTQPAGTLTRWLSQTSTIAATPGTTYRLSAWLKTSAVGAGAARLAATFYNGGYLPSATSTTTLSGTTDWTLVSMIVTAPAGATNLRVEFRLHGPGTLWVDDAAVTRE
jgi:lysophospholipase L1-like esterase